MHGPCLEGGKGREDDVVSEMGHWAPLWTCTEPCGGGDGMAVSSSPSDGDSGERL